jgi:uncharacterized membrane protein
MEIAFALTDDVEIAFALTGDMEIAPTEGTF